MTQAWAGFSAQTRSSRKQQTCRTTRYAYVNNNPLSYTDPSGYFVSKVVKKLTRSIFKALGAEVGSFLIAVGAGIACGPSAPACAAALVSYGSYDNARAHGASSNDAFRSAASSGVSVYGATLIGAGPYGVKAGQPASVQAIALHAGLSCASAIIGGSDCKSAAITGGFTKAISPYIDLYAGSDTLGQRVAGGLVASVVGGTVSELSGGKFANGAVTAAFGYLYYTNDIKCLNMQSLMLNLRSECDGICHCPQLT
jgi:hypothetical protein